MPHWDIALALLSLVAWLYLLLGHGRFWRADEVLGGGTLPEGAAPGVVAVVPARDEADVLERTLESLLSQSYPGPFHVVLADDESADGSAALARAVARRHPRGERLRVIRTALRPAGWVGKTWALASGVARARQEWPQARYLLLTDADVVHVPGMVERLVAKAEREGLHLVSLMVRLRVETVAERLLVPAFVYFFQKLFPFAWVNDPRRRTAAAAGGCMLVRERALRRAGGIEAIREAIIDDCALARALKSNGPIWLGLTTESASIRTYGGLPGVWNMVARSAFTQLHYSWALLAGTLLGLGLLYGVPPLAALGALAGGSPLAGALGAAAWLTMAASFGPNLARYGRAPGWGLALPLAGLLYAGMTLDSARRHANGRGARWKGRDGAGDGRAAGLRAARNRP